MFPSPTCPYMSAFSTILSCIDILSTNPSRFCQKSFFSSMLLPTCGHTRLLCSVWTLLPLVSWPLICLTPSSPPQYYQSVPSSPLSLSHFFFHQVYCRIVCSHLQCSSFYSFSTLFPAGIVHLLSFTPSCLPALFPLQSFFLHLRYQPL